MSVIEYYGKLKSSWDALAVHEPPFSCSCGKCTCGISQQAVARQDGERLDQFFMGLDDTLYGIVRSEQLIVTPLPSLNRAYQVILQEEWLRGLSSTKSGAPDIMAYAVKIDVRMSSKQTSRIFASGRNLKNTNSIALTVIVVDTS
ncbi:hypothetical protein vseg_001952 [Gypsophila vaccaria]